MGYGTVLSMSGRYARISLKKVKNADKFSHFHEKGAKTGESLTKQLRGSGNYVNLSMKGDGLT